MTVVNGHYTDKVELKIFFHWWRKGKIIFQIKITFSWWRCSLKALQGSALTANCKHLKLVSTIQHQGLFCFCIWWIWNNANKCRFFFNWIFQPNCFSVFETRHCHKSSKAVYNLQLAIVLITRLRVEYENQELSDSFLFSCRMHLQTVKQNTDTVPQTTQWIATR